jgi:hypothetical protein
MSAHQTIAPQSHPDLAEKRSGRSAAWMFLTSRGARISGALVVMLMTLWCLAGCRNAPSPSPAGTPPSSERGGLAVSRDEAQDIAKKEVERMHRGSFELGTPTLSSDRYWRVVVEPVKSGAGGRLTNVFPVVVSEHEAEAIASEGAKLRLGDGNFRVGNVESLEGPFWRVVVWWLPAQPEGSIILDVSAVDGTILRR